jgi:hypothetical protein
MFAFCISLLKSVCVAVRINHLRICAMRVTISARVITAVPLTLSVHLGEVHYVRGDSNAPVARARLVSSAVSVRVIMINAAQIYF